MILSEAVKRSFRHEGAIRERLAAGSVLRVKFDLLYKLTAQTFPIKFRFSCRSGVDVRLDCSISTWKSRLLVTNMQ